MNQLKQNFKPMLFSTPMVQAILNGSKTQTRRITKFPKGFIPNDHVWDFIALNDSHPKWKCPLEIKDIIWVRETFMVSPLAGLIPEPYKYKASVSNQFLKEWSGCWKPSLHMPKDACRLFLEVENVRIERLIDLSEDDAILEGVKKQFSTLFNEWRFRDYANVKDDWRSAVSSFQSLWASINGINSWDENPFVWVYTFKVVKCPHGFR